MSSNRLKHWALAPLALPLLLAPAHAAVIASVSATYDAFLENTVFTVTNLTAAAEQVTLLTSLGPTKTVAPFTVAAGSATQYAFNAINGGFLTDPAAVGTPDTTTYQVSVTQGGITTTSAAFSPLSNATGAQVDFLGNQCTGFGPCPVALSGTVATVATPATAPVPEPVSLAILSTGLIGLAARRHRPRHRH